METGIKRELLVSKTDEFLTAVFEINPCGMLIIDLDNHYFAKEGVHEIGGIPIPTRMLMNQKKG